MGRGDGEEGAEVSVCGGEDGLGVGAAVGDFCEGHTEVVVV